MLNTLKRLSPTDLSRALPLLIAASLLAAAHPSLAEEPAPRDASTELAPPGDCAQPRGLPHAAQPTSFQIAGSPADRIVPAQVGSQLRVASNAVPAPPAPPPPGPSLCDDPSACSVPASPRIIEPEPVPGLPPGLGR